MKWYTMVAVAFFVLIICILIPTNPEPIIGELLPFSSKARLEPFPDDVDIDIPDTTENIPEIHKQKCKLNAINPCRQFPNTVCEHFSSETKVHFGSDKSKTLTIKNEDTNEGYCMNIHHLSSRCNIFHGYWALIKKSNEDNSYMKVCVCYRPGYIGNLKLFDPCETPFICDGKVTDISNKFESITCVCKNEEESTRIKNDGDQIEYPACVPKKLSSVVDWDRILIPQIFKNNFIDVDSHYNRDIASNIKPLNQLIDPCSICPLTGQQTDAVAIHAFQGNDTTVFCVPRSPNYGIPFRRSPDNRLLQGDFGPDGVLALKWNKLIVEDNNVTTNPQKFTYVISPCKENKIFYNILNIDYKQFAIDIGENNFLSVTVLPKSSFIPRLFGIAESSSNYIKTGSIAHAADTRGSIDQFYVNTTEGNLTSSVAKSNLITNSAFTWTNSPLCAKKHDDRFEFLTYQEQFQSGSVRQKINLKGFCIRPVSDKQIHASYWKEHMFDKKSYFVDFLISS